ncbi:hypothetical protein EWM64_g75 [Hericium alpestre]|uniref:Uncharacterized protein n=1 Tax=Hericium alpestre TaxID=135208 RepID=A0A4Z0AA38_9AGAM|nr:hypothetical protein EWM64_g75 [Hericium alpestre]
MPFQTRNAYYLRISASTVLPVYLYLDEQHLGWMSDQVLQYVLADLRPKILPKLKAEANAYYGSGPAPAGAKKGTVDVHRGDTYHFAYFFRQAEPHSVLIKTRDFVLDTNPPRPPVPPTGTSESQPAKKKPKRRSRNTENKSSGANGSKKRRKVQVAQPADEDAIAAGVDAEGDSSAATSVPPETARRSSRSTKRTTGIYREQDNSDEEDGEADDVDDFRPDDVAEDEDVQERQHRTTETIVIKNEVIEPVVAPVPAEDVEMPSEGEPAPAAPAKKTTSIAIEITDEVEPKPKLSLKLRYQGFSISGRCLILIVEPWPPMRSVSRAPSLAPMVSTTVRPPSIAPPDFVPSGDATRRSKTPLFLPDYGRDSETPGPSRFRTLPPVPLFNDTSPDEDFELNLVDDDSSLMAFSQLLNTAGERAGGAEDDDEFDGAVFFADADEVREL